MHVWRMYLYLAVALAAGCSSAPPEAVEDPVRASAEASAGTVRLSAEAARRTGLRVVAVERTAVADEVRAPGRLAVNADRTAGAGSFIEGIVLECCASVGSFVRKGESLAVVHSHDTHELLASYRQAMADLRAREGDLEFARQELERAERLLELKAGPLRQVQEARAALRRAESAKRSAEAAIEGIRAHFEYLGVEPQGGEDVGELPHLRVNVRSPIDGWVMHRMVSEGDVVSPAESLYTISDLSSLWALAQVPEEELRYVDVGMEVDIHVRAYPEQTFRGRVTVIGGELDPETRTVQVRCQVPNPGQRLKAGMYAEVTLRSAAPRQELTIPLSAVQRLDDDSIVFVETGEATFAPRRVSLGRENGDRVVALDGLAEGDRIVSHGGFVLKAEMLKGELSEE